MESLHVLLITAVSIAFIHTLIGVDHYLPFIVLGKTNQWTLRKTLLITALCGIGHVLSSIVLGVVGIGLSAGLSLLVDIEDIRGELATWFLIAFGLVYMAYGIRKAFKQKEHIHTKPDGETLLHVHSHGGGQHEHDKHSTNVVWGLFILFLLGPCEPLIPLIMYPAATQNSAALLLVTLAFALCTIATMLGMTLIGLKGLQMVKIKGLQSYAHALAGFAVFSCGLAIKLFGI